MRSRRTRLLLALAATLALPVPLAVAAPMRPGTWEMTMTFTVNGTPQTVPAARECISQKDIDDGNKTLPRPEGACRLSNVLRSSERATYDLACTQDVLTTRGHAEIVYAADAYTGKVNLLVTGKSIAGLPIAMVIDAKRVGECTK